MTTVGLTRVLQDFCQALADGGETDAQLLHRFTAAHDEAAFAALVRRHGRMVLGVCRRILRNSHDAEDAFQATFFILARKADSVVKRESLGCWLHRVAYRVALEAAALNARRLAMEKHVDNLPHPAQAPQEPLDWLPLLDQEVSRLPEKYPFVPAGLLSAQHLLADSTLSAPAAVVSSQSGSPMRTKADQK